MISALLVAVDAVAGDQVHRFDVAGFRPFGHHAQYARYVDHLLTGRVVIHARHVGVYQRAGHIGELCAFGHLFHGGGDEIGDPRP